jgi:hypothetical protein
LREFWNNLVVFQNISGHLASEPQMLVIFLRPKNNNWGGSQPYHGKGCQILLGTTYQTGKINQMNQVAINMPFGRKIDKMAIKIPTTSIARPHKIYPNCNF